MPNASGHWQEKNDDCQHKDAMLKRAHEVLQHVRLLQWIIGAGPWAQLYLT
jgi:hypothetical protein